MKRFLYIALLASSTLNAQEIPPGNFANGIDLLLAGQIDSLPISHLEVIPAIQFDMVGWEFFNENEKKSTQNGGVDLGSFLPITKGDVVEVRDDHLVLLIHEKQGGKIYLASITSQGIPIESFLLHDQYGYLHEKNFRAFSYTEPVRFNLDMQAFEFYQLIYGYEPIPTLENPTQDPIYHQSFHRVVVNDQGRIELNLSEMTGNRIFRREKDCPFFMKWLFMNSVYSLSARKMNHAQQFGKITSSLMATWIRTTQSSFIWNSSHAGKTVSFFYNLLKVPPF